MNDLVTPPGYAEYPRDPKFRPLDAVERLKLISKGYFQLKFWLVMWMFALFFGGDGLGSIGPDTSQFYKLRLLLSLVVGMYLAVVLWLAASKIFRSMDLPGWYATVIALVPSVCYVLSIIGILTGWPTFMAFALSFVGMRYLAHVSAKRGFARLGLKAEFNLSERRLKEMIEELRLRKGRVLPIEVG